MISLQFITHCGKTWMVGINGKSTVNEPSACSGNLAGVPYVGFGSDQLAAAPMVGTLSPCGECGALVGVETSTEVPRV